QRVAVGGGARGPRRQCCCRRPAKPQRAEATHRYMYQCASLRRSPREYLGDDDAYLDETARTGPHITARVSVVGVDLAQIGRIVSVQCFLLRVVDRLARRKSARGVATVPPIISIDAVDSERDRIQQRVCLSGFLVRLATAVVRATPAYWEYNFLPGLGFDIRQARHPFSFTPTIADLLEEALARMRGAHRGD